ncbi:MAG: Secretion system C-terminal sorting domain [Bacteroidota bacterium]|jgi:hypothetical protein|nr:Secretion system C-terminal sorting domain [Bacteroidota bacterium]
MVKKILLTSSLFLLFSVIVNSQDWQTIKTHQKNFYKSTIVQGGYDYPLTNINAIRIDSSYYNGIDSLLFNFYTVRDTSTTWNFPICMNEEGSSWLGKHVLITSSGENIFFNSLNDSIIIRTHAVLGNQWTLYRYPNGNYLEGAVTSISLQNLLGIPDSVKTITLQCKDQNGNSVFDAFNAKTISISKLNGIVSLFDIYSFPNDTTSFYIHPIHVMTNGELNDFNIGDEFGYSGSCNGGPTGGSNPPYGYVRTILGKTYSMNGDTVFYHAQQLNWHYQMNWNPTPHLDFISSLDTTLHWWVTDLLSEVYTEMPAEVLVHDLSIGSFEIVMDDSSYYAGLFSYSIPSDVYYLGDSCYEHPMEQNNSIYQCISGCGCYMLRSVDHTSLPQSECNGNLGYIKKNGVVILGQYPQFPSGLGINESDVKELKLFPNPAQNIITLTYSPGIGQLGKSLEIFDVRGCLIKEIAIEHGVNELTVALDEFSNGFYYFKLGSSVTKKVVIVK